MRLNSWMWIGIMASILWLTVGTAALWMRQQHYAEADWRSLSSARTNCLRTNEKQRAEGLKDYECVSQLSVDRAAGALSPRLDWIFYYVLFWLVVGWIAAGVAALLVSITKGLSTRGQ